MLGKRIPKKDYNFEEYRSAAIWCNAHNCFIDDTDGNYYEIKATPPLTAEQLQAQAAAEAETEKNRLRTEFLDALMAGDTVKTEQVKTTFTALTATKG